MTASTALKKNEEFAKWLAEWVKENEKSCVQVNRMPDKQEDAKKNKPLPFRPTKKTKSFSDRANPQTRVAG
jgi:hypothetical protein